MYKRAIPSRRGFLLRSTAVAVAAAGSTLWGCRGRNTVEPGDLAELTASDAIAAMVRGDIEAEDYARALLDRSARLQALNAFRILVPDDVLETARELLVSLLAQR